MVRMNKPIRSFGSAKISPWRRRLSVRRGEMQCGRDPQTHIALSVSASRTVDGLILPHSHRLGPLATIDGGNLRFEIGDDVRREGADVQKDHYHHHDIFQSPWIGARAG